MISVGTRKPKPMGPVIPPATVGSGTAGAVMYSPGVPGGAVTGGTWSKKPPFSSHVTKSAVFAHCAELTIKAVSIADNVASPKIDGAGGWSESIRDVSNQETCGRFPDTASDRKSTGNCGTKAFW